MSPALAPFVPAPGRDGRARHLVLDLGRDPPPGPPGCEHYPVVPGRRVGMVNRDLLGPALQNVLCDPVAVRRADPRFIGPLGLSERVLHAFAGVLPVMPGRP